MIPPYQIHSTDEKKYVDKETANCKAEKEKENNSRQSSLREAASQFSIYPSLI